MTCRFSIFYCGCKQPKSLHIQKYCKDTAFFIYWLLREKYLEEFKDIGLLSNKLKFTHPFMQNRMY